MLVALYLEQSEKCAKSSKKSISASENIYAIFTMTELQDHLSNCHEYKNDTKTGKCHYINRNWDEQRNQNRQRSFQGTPIHSTSDHIQHGSPDLKRNYIYPSQPSPIQAFQIPSHQPSPKDTRHNLKNYHTRSPKPQEPYLHINVENDDAVAKINAMFPTVSDTHIRLLMKKYHNREALVISALQVEKNPITTPGPFTTPPPQRNIHHPAIHSLHNTPLLSGRCGNAKTQRPNPSPKLKLRYMKSIFPQAEETLILEILSNNDNNIQKTSDALKDMGFEKKNMVKLAQQKHETKMENERKEAEEKIKTLPIVIEKVKTNEEKLELKKKLAEMYSEVADHLITMALESVDFDEKRAIQILKIVIQEDSEKICKENETTIEKTIDEPDNHRSSIPISQSRQSIKSLLKTEKSDKEKSTYSRVIEESEIDYKSKNLLNTKGANPNLNKGPNKKNLLADYVKWQGPNKNLNNGPITSMAKGPNPNLIRSKSCKTFGPNSDLYNGPKYGLAKRSILAQFKNMVISKSH